MNLYISLILILTFLSNFFILRLLIPIFRRYIIDIPEKRSSHFSIKATGGGLVFSLISITANLFLGYYNFLLALPLVIVGFIDDIKKISSKIRFITQLFTVSIIFISNYNFSIFSYNFDANIFLKILFILLIIISSTGIINFINFMDGLDGLVAACMFIVFITASLTINISFLTISISLLAFLFFNWDPAKIFMGDVGSTFIGAIYILVLTQCPNFENFVGMLILASPILLDSLTCLIYRFLKGHNIFKPHKLHLYQRLNQAGFSHWKVTCIYLTLTLVFSITYLNFDINYLYALLIMEIFIGIYLNKNYALSFVNDKVN